MDFRIIERELREFFEAEGSDTVNAMGDIYISTGQIYRTEKGLSAPHGDNPLVIVNLTELAKRLADMISGEPDAHA